MFNVNDTVIYGNEGVCRVVGIEENEVSGVKKTYYVLKPVVKEGSRSYVPIDNEALVNKMRRILTKEEIDELIDSLPEEPVEWISSERERRDAYKKLLDGASRYELMRMIHTVYLEKQRREEKNKRLYIVDERFLQDAEHCLYSEMAYVLNIGREQIVPYIIARIENKKKANNYRG